MGLNGMSFKWNMGWACPHKHY